MKIAIPAHACPLDLDTERVEWRTVSAQGISIGGKKFLRAGLVGLTMRRVVVRYGGRQPPSCLAYHWGQFVCECLREDLLDEADRQAIYRARSAARKTAKEEQRAKLKRDGPPSANERASTVLRHPAEAPAAPQPRFDENFSPLDTLSPFRAKTNWPPTRPPRRARAARKRVQPSSPVH